MAEKSGGVIQRLHEYFDSKYKEAAHRERVDVEKARAITVAYCLFYQTDSYKVRAIEEPFDLPVYDITTGEPLVVKGENGGITPHYCGIVDSVLEKQGKIYFCDHKTASARSVSGPTYWEELKTNQQLSHYSLAARQMGLEIGGFLWDVIIKPGIAPRQLRQKDIKEMLSGSYCGIPFTGYNGEEYKTKETPQMYGHRLLAAINDAPDKTFKRLVIHRTDADLLDYATELTQVVKEMARAKADESLRFKSRKACTNWNRLCAFHSICAGDTDADDPTRYQPSKPPKKARKTPSGSLSTSRLGTFLECRAKWGFKYVDKIEPVREEYSDSLAIGSMIHKGIEMFLESRLTDPISFESYCNR